MKHQYPNPPSLKSISQCINNLDFLPLAAWPTSLPAVAINSYIIAGFEQKLVFDHTIDPTDKAAIAELFNSLYPELSFAELARLQTKVKNLEWFPLELICTHYNLKITQQFQEVADVLLQQPIGFQNWCAQKKINCADLLPLLSAKTINLKPLLHKILVLNLSKSLGAQALELGIELLLMGKSPNELNLEQEIHAEIWLAQLKTLRHPEAFAQDNKNESEMKGLPWPGMSQAKWVRQGDRSGVELKLFVTNPTDLKKYLQSLQQVQELMEKKGDSWTKH